MHTYNNNAHTYIIHPTIHIHNKILLMLLQINFMKLFIYAKYILKT